ncbi:hypothetical protein T484DRAFT_1882626 [Baffinella frigidus]|nr:hypothetical protein T484DRAFT_1882626 [Cryptophyta sp. CCMP2293]
MRRTSLLTPILLLHLTLLALAAASVNESVNESAVPEGGQELADAGDSQGEDEDGLSGRVSTQEVEVVPGFIKTGRRISITFDKKECAMSYSAMGEHSETWSVSLRVTPWRSTCVIKSPKESKLNFSFYSISLLGGKGQPIIQDVEVWGHDGALAREEHYVMPQGASVRNAAGFVGGLARVSISRERSNDVEELSEYGYIDEL